jgi:hypothetical protein
MRRCSPLCRTHVARCGVHPPEPCTTHVQGSKLKQHLQETAIVLCAAPGDASLAALLLVAAATAWTATSLGSLLCSTDVRTPQRSARRVLAIAVVLAGLAPFIPATAALALTIALGLHAIVTAIVRVRDQLASA